MSRTLRLHRLLTAIPHVLGFRVSGLGFRGVPSLTSQGSGNFTL